LQQKEAVDSANRVNEAGSLQPFENLIRSIRFFGPKQRGESKGITSNHLESSKAKQGEELNEKKYKWKK
jgi:hypothetical protein